MALTFAAGDVARPRTESKTSNSCFSIRPEATSLKNFSLLGSMDWFKGKFTGKPHI